MSGRVATQRSSLVIGVLVGYLGAAGGAWARPPRWKPPTTRVPAPGHANAGLMQIDLVGGKPFRNLNQILTDPAVLRAYRMLNSVRGKSLLPPTRLVLDQRYVRAGLRAVAKDLRTKARRLATSADPQLAEAFLASYRTVQANVRLGDLEGMLPPTKAELRLLRQLDVAIAKELTGSNAALPATFDKVVAFAYQVGRSRDVLAFAELAGLKGHPRTLELFEGLVARVSAPLGTALETYRTDPSNETLRKVLIKSSQLYLHYVSLHQLAVALAATDDGTQGPLGRAADRVETLAERIENRTLSYIQNGQPESARPSPAELIAIFHGGQ